MLTSESEIKSSRKNYKSRMYFTLSIVLTVLVWGIFSEIRWLFVETTSGDRFQFDMWILFGVILIIVMISISYLRLGQTTSNMKRECNVFGGSIHMEEQHVVFWLSIIIGFLWGMVFWDVVIGIHLIIDYGFFSIWTIDVIVYSFGFYDLVFTVWQLFIISTIKGLVALWMFLITVRNVKRGTMCEVAEFNKNAIFR